MLWVVILGNGEDGERVLFKGLVLHGAGNDLCLYLVGQGIKAPKLA